MESIAVTALLGAGPMSGSYCCKDVLSKQKPSDLFRLPLTQFIHGKASVAGSFPRRWVQRSSMLLIRSQAAALIKEACSFQEKGLIPRDVRPRNELTVDWRLGLWPPENKADNPALNNPLLRQEKMGCGWLGAILEWEGVLIEDNPDLEKHAWLALSREEGKSPPPAFILQRIEGMKNEQAITEVLCWSRDPNELQRMACRKEEIYRSLHGGVYRFRPGSQEFVNILMHYKVPMALVSTRPRKYLETAIDVIGIRGIFNVIVAAEDVHRGKPDPEMFMCAAQLLQFIPERCIVFGNSNWTVEAAHDARMKCVVVASKHPVYELGAADLVAKHLDELSVVDLKNLADIESSQIGPGKPELETEVEEENRFPPSSIGVDDGFW